MMITMKRELPGSEKQKEQRARFKAAALTYRDLTPQQRKNLHLWGAMRDDLISGYDWWTKAKLTDISIQAIIDEMQIHDVNFLNRDLQLGGLGFDYWVTSQKEDAYAKLALWEKDDVVKWEVENTVSGKVLYDMDCLVGGNPAACGTNGELWIREGSWIRYDVGSSEHLNQVHWVNAGELGPVLWIAGNSGNAFKYYNGTVTKLPSTGIGLQSIFGLDGQRCIAGTYNGYVYYFDGSAWNKLGKPFSLNAVGLYAESENSIWAATFDKLAYWNGSAWITQQPSMTGQIMDMWGCAGSDIWAVTNYGEMLHYDGSSWTKVVKLWFTGRSIHGSAGDDVWAVGTNGYIAHYNGKEWKRSSNNYGNGRGIATDGSGNVWIGAMFDFKTLKTRVDRHALLHGGSSATSSATLEMADFFTISIVSGATIVYGCKMKRIDENHPLPEIILMMYDMDDNYYTDSFIPQAADDGWANYQKEVTAPANLNYIKIAAQAEKRNGYADMAYVDDFFIKVSGRYLVAKCEHPLLERTMITSEDGSIVYYDSSEV